MRKRTRAIAEVTERLFYELCEETGEGRVLYHKISRDWPKLLEAKLAACSKPISLSFYKDKTTEGVLLIEVTNPSAAMIIKAQESTILKKLASYFGYKAISSVRIKVVPSATPTAVSLPKPQPRTITAAQSEALHTCLHSISDHETKGLLARLAIGCFDLH